MLARCRLHGGWHVGKGWFHVGKVVVVSARYWLVRDALAVGMTTWTVSLQD